MRKPRTREEALQRLQEALMHINRFVGVDEKFTFTWHFGPVTAEDKAKVAADLREGGA